MYLIVLLVSLVIYVFWLDIKKAIKVHKKAVADSVREVKCPCCGEMTRTQSAIMDTEDDHRDIVTCEVNECEFYMREYTDGTIVLEPIFESQKE